MSTLNKRGSHQERSARDDLNQKLLRYSTIAVAALSVGTESVTAAVHYTPYGVPGVGVSGISHTLDLDANGSVDFSFLITTQQGGNLGSWTGSYYSTQNYAKFSGAAGLNLVHMSLGYARLLNTGVTIHFAGGLQNGNLAKVDHRVGGTWGGSEGFVVSYSTSITGGPFAGSRGFIGASFDIGGNSHLAWIDIGVNGDVSLMTIYGWAFEDSANTAITTGDMGAPAPVPLPAAGSLFSLALGAGGLLERRRRRKLALEHRSSG